MKLNSEIRQETLKKMKGNWWPAVLAFLVFLLCSIAISTPGSIYQVVKLTPSAALTGGCSILTIFLLLPMQLGAYNAYKALYTNGDTSITANMFEIGFKNYWHNLGGYLLTGIFIILWFCLLIIPGIIMALAYFCVPYILAEEPELTPMQAIKKSRAMMKGHKTDLFLIMLGYLGFAMLSILTAGIALIWIVPYYYTVLGNFYESIKAEQ